MFHKDDCLLEIDRLMVEQEYRRCGIGKKLIRQALTVFNEITICSLFVLKFGNEGARRFYESLGFVNLGEPKIDKQIWEEVSHKDLHFYYQLDLAHAFNAISQC